MSDLPSLQRRLAAELAAFDRLRRAVWVFDPATSRGLYANPAALALWDAESLAELLGRDFSALSPAVRTRTARLAEATAGGDSVTERWTFYPHGRPVTVQAVVSGLAVDDDRSVLLFEAAEVDVGEAERRAVEALRHTSSLITLFDAAGAPRFANPAAYAGYGGDTVGFVARFADAAHGGDVLGRVLAGEVVAELSTVRTVYGERSHHLDAARVLDPVTGEACILLSERDVTAQVEAERALATETERAEVAVAKQRFLANMSHELRTPLNSVIGFADLLAAEPLASGPLDHVARIRAAGGDLLTLVNDVIALSEFDAGQVVLAEDPVELDALLALALREVAPRAVAKGLALRLDAPDALPPVIGDARRLRTVLHHYLDNAVKFAGRGEIVLRLALAPHGDDAVACNFAVLDEGPGVEPETIARLFDRLSPGDDGPRKRHGGVGLGLAIVKESLALMGGAAGVDSRPGAGACFWARVVLPLDAAAARTRLEAPAAEARTADERPLRVLYADDHEGNRRVVQLLLASAGHACDVVPDGADAVRAVAAGGYDVVLMDIQMPGMDGVAATREIRRTSAVPIIAVTANTLSAQLAEYAAAGMQDCVPKPVEPGALFDAIAGCLAGSTAATARENVA